MVLAYAVGKAAQRHEFAQRRFILITGGNR